MPKQGGEYEKASCGLGSCRKNGPNQDRKKRGEERPAGSVTSSDKNTHQNLAWCLTPEKKKGKKKRKKGGAKKQKDL